MLITDGLHMGAITPEWSIPDAAVQALVAGADVALASNFREADDVHDEIVAAVRSGALSEARLDAAVNRVLRTKGYPGTERDCLLG